jgi:hypothetical protein
MRTVIASFLLFACAGAAQSQSFDLQGYVAGRAINATGPASWLEGGAGRFEATGDRDDFMGVAQLGVDWTPSTFLRVHASGTARHDPSEFRGDSAGLVEAYADLHGSFGLDDVQLRAGQFFLPSSRENIDPLWASPYTINYSALNTWIGQEVRPIGVDLQYRHVTGAGHFITGGATAFRGNDTMGTLLAWRGWSIGSRLSTYGETLPLPPLPSLSDSGTFFRQRDDGTTPFTNDLDGHTGFAGRVRYSIPQRGSVQYTYVDNQGDRKLYPPASGSFGEIYSPRAEYSWATTFHLVSAEIGNPDALVFAAEYMRGNTLMGVFENYVDADFDALYVLVSHKRGRNRWTARYEVFGTDERDFSALGERNDESLRSWTLAWLFDVRDNIRAGAEFTQITGQRADVADPDGRTFTVEARYNF